MGMVHRWTFPDGRTMTFDRPRVMGILNVTPDSFSDGGNHNACDTAVVHARSMLDQGAAVIDVGGESTRPGAQRVSPQEQIARTVDVVRAITQLPGAVVSIDTTRADVAEAALDAGAMIINDVSAGREDPRMFDLAANRGVPLTLMHMLGEPTTMQNDPHYDDVVGEVEAFLLKGAEEAEAAGVARGQIMLDPGIGFGKTREHNLSLMAALPRFVALGYPILLGASRKRFMGSILTGADGQAPKPTDLLGATCATSALAGTAGVAMVRVHDVEANRQAALVAHAIAQSGRG